MEEDEQRIADYISKLGEVPIRTLMVTIPDEEYKLLIAEIGALKLRVNILEQALYLQATPRV